MSQSSSITVRLPSWRWIILKRSWMEFARCERQQYGLHPFVPSFVSSSRNLESHAVKYACSCRKSAISFPHWPPTSYDEAIEQLRCIIGNNVDHRKSLASCWLSFVNRKAFGEVSVSATRNWYRRVAFLIKISCPIFAEEQRKEEREALCRQALINSFKAFSCSTFCDPVLRERRHYCLCHCGRHRDDCPVHGDR